MSETEHVRVCSPMPCLNRIQLLWSYLRNPLRRCLDLADAFRNRPALSKMACKACVRSVLASVHAQAASNVQPNAISRRVGKFQTGASSVSGLASRLSMNTQNDAIEAGV